MANPQYTVIVADGDRVPQMTVKIAESGARAQMTMRVAEEGDRPQLTVKIAESGARAQMTVILDGYSAGSAYAARVLALEPIAYYALNGDATDSSGNGFDGTATGATFGATGIGDGNTAASFDGSSDGIDISAAAAVLSGDAGSVALWAKTNAWGDSTLRFLFQLIADGGNLVRLTKDTVLNELGARRIGDETPKSIATTALAGAAGYFHIALTWSVAANQLKLYLNGVAVGSTVTGLDPFATPLDSATIGASSGAGANAWSGQIAHVAIFDRVLSGAEVLDLGVL